MLFPPRAPSLLQSLPPLWPQLLDKDLTDRKLGSTRGREGGPGLLQDHEARHPDRKGGCCPQCPSLLPEEAVWTRTVDRTSLGTGVLRMTRRTERGTPEEAAVGVQDLSGVCLNADLLRCVLLERGELVKEVQSLKETLETERAEWLQFQSDLQVAVSVADRLHLEAQEELEKLRGDQEEKERQLATARERQLEAERELETARAELEESRRKVAALTVELGEPRGGTQARTGQVAGGGSAMVTDRSERKQGSGGGTESGLREGPVAEQPQVDGKGVSEASLQSTAPEEKNRGEGRNSPSAMRAVEQSRSLSRLPLPSSSTSTMNGISQATTTTSQGSLSKNWNPTRGKRADPALEGQETGSTEKQEEVEPANKHSATSTDVPHKVSKAQDGFSLLLRRHGGSKRNSLLRWCQSRTQGYKNIDITNFSSSWSDGLAFCAVYHTYLPSLIPYSSLCPADRVRNLSLAFRTGESVGITASLTVDEVLRRGGPDWQKVLGYVESIYRHFEM
ncbi:hypothetical protein ANANG_G00018350 [Anguilla anguilla]|uniref:Cytospin-A n=1 Tax=Anguilla anguilla TaxID=7936 RepID=A0A9D3MYP2_ANGAN|nr:hypothetical protein ANANG_G00018350 [Anguilla anguilla]